MSLRIEALVTDDRDVLDALAGLIVEAVANGASVTFMHPLDVSEARAFWQSAFAGSAEHERVIIGAWDGDVLAGTVTLLLGTPQNQRHRAEIAKLIVRLDRRGRGIASALMREAETIAIARGRSLLSLDTAGDGGASGLYEKLGFTRAGEIPGYALKPHGGLTAAVFYWKRIGKSAIETASC